MANNLWNDTSKRNVMTGTGSRETHESEQNLSRSPTGLGEAIEAEADLEKPLKPKPPGSGGLPWDTNTLHQPLVKPCWRDCQAHPGHFWEVLVIKAPLSMSIPCTGETLPNRVEFLFTLWAWLIKVYGFVQLCQLRNPFVVDSWRSLSTINRSISRSNVQVPA